jgi:hypothetical protein
MTTTSLVCTGRLTGAAGTGITIELDKAFSWVDEFLTLLNTGGNKKTQV